MGFQAEVASNGSKINYPKLKDGEEGSWALPARISLIVDLGTQPQQDYREEYDANKKDHQEKLKDGYASLEEQGGKQYILIPRSPTRQVAIFADLVSEMMDYGEEIGKKPYRIMLNKSFKGEITGAPLTISKARDNNGKIIDDSPVTFNSKSLLAKLGKACGVSFAKNGNDIRELANKPFACTVENKVKGEACYTNFAGASPMMAGIEVPELPVECQLITFEEATADQMMYLWKNIKTMIKNSPDYENSQIKKAMEEFEARKTENSDSAPKTNDKKDSEDFDDDVPF